MITLHAFGRVNSMVHGLTRDLRVQWALEELGLPYQVRGVDHSAGETKADAFRHLSPFHQLPVIEDDGMVLSESGAILVYLAEKTGKLMSRDAARRYETLQWVMFQMGGIGPMFGQLGFFHKFAGKDFEDKRPRDRYVAESKRLLGVLDKHLKGRQWIMGDEYTIADIASFPWIRNLNGFYGAGELVGFDDFTEVKRVLDAFVARPAVERGLNIPPR
jgi:GST-like protein